MNSRTMSGQVISAEESSRQVSADRDQAAEDLRWLPTAPFDSVNDFELDHLIEKATAMLNDEEATVNQWGNHIAQHLLRERLYDLEMEDLDRDQKCHDAIRAGTWSAKS